MGEYADMELDRLFDQYSLCGDNRRRPYRIGTARQLEVIPADAETRALRQRAHLSFDRIWRRQHMHRAQAYRWLARELNVSEPEAHMGQMLDHDRLNRVIELCDEYLGTTAVQDDFPDDL